MMIQEQQQQQQQQQARDEFPHYKRVANYLLGNKIGEGSFAKVYVGLHTPTGEKVSVTEARYEPLLSLH